MKSTARRDLWLLAAWAVIAALLCDRFDLSEAITRWARPHEALQLDELPGILLAVALGLCWYAYRRYREAKTQLTLREAADESLSRALEENRRLARSSLETQESERRALARDLHDELGQYINVIKLDAVALRDAVDPKGAQAIATGMIGNIDRIYDVVRSLIRELRPVGLDVGLKAAVENCVYEWQSRLPAKITLSISGELDQVGEIRAIALYRFVQEALTNIARHAAAEHIEVNIEVDRDHKTLEARICDDGRGAQTAKRSTGLGLLGMRERMAALGGTVEVLSQATGFGVRAFLPLPESEA
jgi:signal transduction histidine kinase